MILNVSEHLCRNVKQTESKTKSPPKQTPVEPEIMTPSKRKSLNEQYGQLEKSARLHVYFDIFNLILLRDNMIMTVFSKMYIRKSKTPSHGHLSEEQRNATINKQRAQS